LHNSTTSSQDIILPSRHSLAMRTKSRIYLPLMKALRLGIDLLHYHFSLITRTLTTIL